MNIKILNIKHQGYEEEDGLLLRYSYSHSTCCQSVPMRSNLCFSLKGKAEEITLKIT